MRETLVRRALPATIVGAVLGVGVLWISASLTVRIVLENRESDWIRDTTTKIAADIPVALWDDRPGATQYLENLSGIGRIALITREGSLWAQSEPEIEVPAGFINRPAQANGVLIVEPRDDTGQTVRWASAFVGPMANPSGYLVAGVTTPGIDRAVRTASLTMAMLGLMVILVISFIHLRSLQRINQPLRALQSAANWYARGDLTINLHATGHGVFQGLASDLNAMASALRARLTMISGQRNQLEGILRSMVEGVIVLNGSRQVLSVNRACAELLQISEDAAIGQSLIKYVRNAQLDSIVEESQARVATVEQTITLYRGRPIHLQVHASPMQSVGGDATAGTLLVMNDITRLVQLENMRTDFVANVSHELKTPITSIAGFVETLLEDDEIEPDRRKRFLGIALTHANRLNLIIEDLLALSRLEHSNEPIAVGSFDISDLLESAERLCAAAAAERAIVIRTDSHGPKNAIGNQSLLEQALVNLIDNAIKYGRPETHVSVRSICTDTSLEISVADCGVGIDPNDIPRLFERFYRTDKARSRELGGTGLGLAIVKHICRAHGGDVRVTSTSGQGSTFTMTIPQVPTQPADDRQESHPRTQLER